MSVQIQLRRGTSSDWNTQAVAAGEPVLVTGNAKGPLVYIGVTGQNFSGLNAQVASFQPQGGGTTRYGHVVATDQDYTFQMLAAADNARALGMASGGSFTIKSGASFVVDDGATVDFDARPDLNKGARIFVGIDDNNDGVTEQGTIEIKRDAEMVVNVSQQGDVEISPFNATTGTQKNFVVKQSSNDDICAEFQDPNGGQLLQVDNSGINSIPAVTLGGTPANHADPSFKGKIQSACTPNLVDASAVSTNLNERFFTLHHQGVGEEGRGQLRINGGRSVTTAAKAILIQKNDAAIGTGFSVDYDGGATMRDGVITRTDRSLQDDSLVRKDELLPTILGALSFRSSEQVVANTGFPVGAIRGWHKRDADGKPDTLSFSELGGTDAPDNQKSMEEAPTGTYVIYSVRFNDAGQHVQVRDTDFFTVSHTKSFNTTVHAYADDSNNNCYFGWVMRIA